MDNVSPILLVCGVVCIWPLLCSFIAFYLGRRGMPIRIVRSDYVGRSNLRSKMAIKEE